MNKLFIFGLGAAIGSVVPLVTQVYLLNDRCTSLEMELQHTKNDLDDCREELHKTEEKLFYKFAKHQHGPRIGKQKPKNPIGFVSC